VNRLAKIHGGWVAALWVPLLCASFIHAGQVRTGIGTLRAIYPRQRMAVVEIADSGGPMTVAGQLVGDGGGGSGGLDRLQAGDRVRVDWQKTSTGHEILLLEAVLPSSAASQPGMPWDRRSRTVVGTLRQHVVRGRETLLDIARTYDLGFNAMEDLYPAMDPWLPPEGRMLTIPSRWVLPESKRPEVVVNVAELRLYRFRQAAGYTTVETFPVGIGDLDWPTPTGEFQIHSKVTHPTWVIPASLRAKYGRAVIPPGPDNPLGDYWMRLEGTSYGIHGTDLPWSVGRLVTHGCIRLYPEDMAYLFHSLALPAAVRLIYEPVKIGLADGRVYAEVHRDVYGLIADFRAYGFQRLAASKWRHSVDAAAFAKALEERRGLPVDVTAEAVVRAAQEQPRQP
jgi:L,D-transpeptidase ErfK/SrfK